MLQLKTFLLQFKAVIKIFKKIKNCKHSSDVFHMEKSVLLEKQSHYMFFVLKKTEFVK